MPSRPVKNCWQLQDAKARFSHVVDEALAHGPQIITRHGKQVAVVQSLEAFRQAQAKRTKRESLLAFLRRSPLAGVELDLTREHDIDREPPQFR